MLIYLSSKYQVADHWYPADLQARARVHEYLGWHTDNIRGIFGVPLWTKVCSVLWGGIDPVRVKVTFGALLLFCQVLGPLIGTQIPEEKVERNRKNMFYVRVSAASGGKVLWGWDLPYWPSGNGG